MFPASGENAPSGKKLRHKENGNGACLRMCGSVTKSVYRGVTPQTFEEQGSQDWRDGAAAEH